MLRNLDNPKNGRTSEQIEHSATDPTCTDQPFVHFQQPRKHPRSTTITMQVSSVSVRHKFFVASLAY